MAEVADFIARHAILVLSGITFVALLLTTVFWHVVHTYGTRVWSQAVSLWNFFRSTALARSLKSVPILGPFLNRTLTVVRYLGLYALLAFGVAFGALSIFFGLADEIGFDESLAQFDDELAKALARHLPHDILEFFAVITHLGDPEFLMVLGAVVAVTLFALKRWVLAAAWIVTTIGGGLINILLKRFFERPRPVHEHGLVAETSWSFPSGHASGSMLVYSLLGYLIVRHAPRAWRIPVTVLTVAVIVFVGSSRVLLQVHYLSDVLAGYASAIAWSALCIAGLETVRWREKNL